MFSYNDIIGSFIERGIELENVSGYLGAITARTCFYLKSFERWRSNILFTKTEINLMADLGHGVMDNAMVEASAYILRVC